MKNVYLAVGESQKEWPQGKSFSAGLAVFGEILNSRTELMTPAIEFGRSYFRKSIGGEKLLL